MKYENPYSEHPKFVDLGGFTDENGEYCDLYAIEHSDTNHWALGARLSDRDDDYRSGDLSPQYFGFPLRQGYSIFEVYKRLVQKALYPFTPTQVIYMGKKYFLEGKSHGYVSLRDETGVKTRSELECEYVPKSDFGWMKPYEYNTIS